jgi:cyclic pyranopterin phosphate synthase
MAIISYLRVPITDRCNERCTYCMPQELQEWLPPGHFDFEETLRLIRTALSGFQGAVTRAKPLTRRGVLNLVRAPPDFRPSRHWYLDERNVARAGSGTRPDHGNGAATAGVRSVNISLDTLDRQLY